MRECSREKRIPYSSKISIVVYQMSVKLSYTHRRKKHYNIISYYYVLLTCFELGIKCSSLALQNDFVMVYLILL